MKHTPTPLIRGEIRDTPLTPLVRGDTMGLRGVHEGHILNVKQMLPVTNNIKNMK